MLVCKSIQSLSTSCEIHAISLQGSREEEREGEFLGSTAYTKDYNLQTELP